MTLLLVPSDGFPIFRSFPRVDLRHRDHFTGEGDTVEITYTNQIKELLYKAELRVGPTLKQVVVKFTNSYSTRAHEVCESVQCAPMLYFVGQVSRLLFLFLFFLHSNLLSYFRQAVSL